MQHIGVKSLVSTLLAGFLTVGAASTASAAPVEDPWTTIRSSCMMGNEGACKTVYSEGKVPEKAKDCLVKGGVAAAGAIVVGRVNKELADRLAKQTVIAGATACVAAITP